MLILCIIFYLIFSRENHRLLTCSGGEWYPNLQKRISWCSGLQASEARQCHVSRYCDRKNSFRGHVEYVLSAHQSLWQCLCQSLGTVMRYSSLERSQLGLSGWRELAGSGGSVSWKLHLKQLQLHAPAAVDQSAVSQESNYCTVVC